MSVMFTSLIGTSDAPVPPPPPETLLRIDFVDEYVSSEVTIVVESATESSGNIVDWGDGTSDTYGAGVTTLTHDYGDLCEYVEVCEEYCWEECDEWFDEDLGDWVYDNCQEVCEDECWEDAVCNFVFDISIKGASHRLEILPVDTVASIEVIQLSSALTDCRKMLPLTNVRADVLRIPDGVTDCTEMFGSSSVRISEIIIPPSVVKAPNLFGYAVVGEVIVGKVTFLPGRTSTPPNIVSNEAIAGMYISLITIPDSVEDCSYLLASAGPSVIVDKVILPPTIKNCSYMFGYSEMRSLPEGFTVPAGAENCEGMFRACEIEDLDIANLLADWSAADTGTRNVKNMFSECLKVGGTAPAEKLWNNHNIDWVNTRGCFELCTGLDNYEEIPESWGYLPE